MSTFYILSKLFTFLVLPPGLFIIISILALFFLKKFRLFFALCAFGFYVLSISPVSDALLGPLELPFNQNISEFHAQGVVVLAGGSVVGSSNLPLSGAAYKRAVYGLMLAKKHELPLLFSGAGRYKKFSESDAFMQSMQELSQNLKLTIPSSKEFKLGSFALHVEDKSLDTYENAKLSKKKFTSKGISKPTIFLVTSAFHMKRAKILYEHFGFQVIPAATDFRVSSKPKTSWAYLPNMGAFTKSYLALHEYAGLFSLIFRGIL